MFGGTPSNLAISVMDRGKIEVIAGVNLPMLIKLASLRQTESLERTVARRPGGRALNTINVASQLLSDAADELRPANDPTAGNSVPPAGAVRAVVTICNQKGLHARAAVRSSRPPDNSTPRCGCAKNGTGSPAATSWSC